MPRDAMPPAWLPPMLATLGDATEVPTTWPVEPKWDGARCLAVLHPVRGVRLWSRGRRDYSATFIEVTEALARRARGFGILDGEVVAGARGTQGDFGLLQGRLGIDAASRARASGIAIAYHVFDVLWWDGVDRRALPWTARHALVRETLRFGGVLHRTPAWRRGQTARFARICERGGEGLIAKRPDAPYQGRRSRDWIKLKCERTGDFVVGGWTAPAGSRVGLGALLVGAWEDGVLRFAGRVGTGFSDAELLATRARLEAREVAASPFANAPARERARWVRPELVAHVGYTEWTRDGRLRHPRFLEWRRSN